MGERELKEQLEQLNSDIKLAQKQIDEKKKSVETQKRSKKASIEYLKQIAQAQDILKSLKEQDKEIDNELEESKNS